MSLSQQSISDMYDEHADAIYRFIVWHSGDVLLAEDLTGEVFLRAWKYRDKLTNVTMTRAWLYRIAQNLLTDHWRKAKPVPLDDDFDAIGDDNVHDNAQRAEEAKIVRRYIAKLKPEMRSVIILRFFEHLSSDQVAVILNKTPENVRVIQYRALKALKKYYESERT